MLLLLVEIRGNRGHDRFLVDHLATGAVSRGNLAETPDPIVDGRDFLLGRLGLAVEFLIAVVGHLLLRDLDEKMRAVRIAGQNEIGIPCELVEMQDVAEVLGGLRAFQRGARLMAARAVLLERVEGRESDWVWWNRGFA